jgi:hypothetical protein
MGVPDVATRIELDSIATECSALARRVLALPVDVQGHATGEAATLLDRSASYLRELRDRGTG